MMWNDWWWDWMWPWGTTTPQQYTWSTTSDPGCNKTCQTNRISSDDDIETENNTTEDNNKAVKETSQDDAMAEIFATIDKFYKANGMTGDAVITTDGKTKCFKLGEPDEKQNEVDKSEQEKKAAYESLVEDDKDIRNKEQEIRDKVKAYNKAIDKYNEAARKYHYMRGSSYGPIFSKSHITIR